MERVEVKRSQLKYTIRACQKLEELGALVKVQREIWGYAEHELYPLRLFVTLRRIGGQALGAFTPQGSLAGFVASLPAWHGTDRYYHSLSLGVLRAHENRGLGRALKMAQRREALRAGIDLIEWTFDPSGRRMRTSTLFAWAPSLAFTNQTTTVRWRAGSKRGWPVTA